MDLDYYKYFSLVIIIIDISQKIHCIYFLQAVGRDRLFPGLHHVGVGSGAADEVNEIAFFLKKKKKTKLKRNHLHSLVVLSLPHGLLRKLVCLLAI